MKFKILISIFIFLIFISFVSAECLPVTSPTTNATDCCSKRAVPARGEASGLLYGQLVCVAGLGGVGESLDNILSKLGIGTGGARSRFFPTEQEKLTREQREAEQKKWAQEQEALLLYRSIETKARIRIVWSYVRAIFILLVEVLKLIFYVVELMMFVYVFLVLIPYIFFRVRDKIVENYMGRGAT